MDKKLFKVRLTVSGFGDEKAIRLVYIGNAGLYTPYDSLEELEEAGDIPVTLEEALALPVDERYIYLSEMVRDFEKKHALTVISVECPIGCLSLQYVKKPLIGIVKDYQYRLW